MCFVLQNEIEKSNIHKHRVRINFMNLQTSIKGWNEIEVFRFHNTRKSSFTVELSDQQVMEKSRSIVYYNVIFYFIIKQCKVHCTRFNNRSQNV